MSKPHPHENVIIAYYRGEPIQVWREKWVDLPVYVPDSRAATWPNFSPNGGYRVKPITVRLDLDKEEIETLWAVLQYVGGDSQTTARCHVDSLLSKIDNRISPERKDELAAWDLVDDFQSITGFRFVKNLP